MRPVSQVMGGPSRDEAGSRGSCLLQLDQGAGEVLGVEEQHRLVVGTDLGLAVAQDAGAAGLVHVVNAGSCSRLELALEAIGLAGLEGRVEVEEREAGSGGAPRPTYSALDSSRHADLTGRPMRSWRDALRAYLETLEATMTDSLDTMAREAKATADLLRRTVPFLVGRVGEPVRITMSEAADRIDALLTEIERQEIKEKGPIGFRRE